ncbi:MAG: phosphatidylglycerophosphatase A [Pseudomonadota bacterium]
MIERLGIFLAVGCGSGLLRPAPGTWGSLAAVGLGYVMVTTLGHISVLIAALVSTLIGVWAANVYERRTTKSDASEVVIDEWAGQWFALWPTAFLAPTAPLAWAGSFLLFRAFDISKPGPIGKLDRELKGGLGVMMDDVLAGLLAGALMFAGLSFYGG